MMVSPVAIPHTQTDTVTLYHGDSLSVLAGIADCSIDAIVTDPPYGLSFMGKRWDYDVPGEDLWRECLRVLKPGGHLLCFAGTRTQHRMAVRIEDAGFEIRDMIAWVYGSGFPKSLDVSKAIDKAAGAERDVLYTVKKTPSASGGCNEGWQRPWAEGKTTMNITSPATESARQWQGFGTALKPALEPITVARKPLIGTVAENVLQHGTGALNIDGCRVGLEGGTAKGSKPLGDGNGIYGKGLHGGCEIIQLNLGRWPANLIHDGSEEVLGLFPADKQGSAARFFYAPKASKRDRDEGLTIPLRRVKMNNGNDAGGDPVSNRFTKIARNHHPTVKPTDLMRYLCRLVTPTGGVVLDPFMGSGSTGKAAAKEGFRFVGIEREAEYIEIAAARIANERVLC